MSKEPKKTVYRFIKFVEIDALRVSGRQAWYCLNKKSETRLGEVGYYPTWRQYVFVAASRVIVFSADCLRDIAHFMEQLK